MWWNKKEEVVKDNPAFDMQAYQEKAVDELVIKLNSINSEPDWRARAGKWISGGSDNADTMHDIFQDFGYPEKLVFSHSWNMYRRFGVARAVITAPVNICFITHPVIESDDENFKKDVEKLIERIRMWQKIKGLDTRQRVGRYAGLFMQVRDNQKPDTKLGEVSGVDALVDMKPMYESQLKVDETFEDPSKENYGQPKHFDFDPSEDGTRNEHVTNSIKIDPSRIVLAAEGADDGSIYGIPALECCYNDLMDLRKISGAGGEGFYQNTRNAPFFEAGENFRLDDGTDAIEKLEEAIDEWLSKHRKRLMLQGVKPHYPNIQLPIPKEFMIGCINNIAAGTDIPSAILVGQQTGRLAAEKDSDYFLTMIQSRRDNFLTNVIEDVINWCIKHGVLPEAKYKVVWDDVMATAKADKIALSKKLADVNQQAFSAGSSLPFSPEEIREAGGYEVEGFEFIEPEDDDDEVIDVTKIKPKEKKDE